MSRTVLSNDVTLDLRKLSSEHVNWIELIQEMFQMQTFLLTSKSFFKLGV